ncbi:MAG: Gfo/Idh/MocA family oxidoreductase [Nonlabens sp.]|jgi:predicted dehydrogenase|uniref:Gfo/Idh/MocA family protein n=1 Tax=Nonlabens sp. TaxID=1888209 RepID=UPI0035A606F1
MVKFGIIGLGKVAHKFAHDLALVDGCVLQAVGSRNLKKARKFATEHQATQFYSSYEEVAADPEIAIIYIATPHVFHFENTMMCLHAGKAVICEKPFAMNLEEVEIMIQTAKDKNLFLMEALWTRFIPSTLKVIELMEQNTIGKIHSIQANFGYVATTDPTSRLIARELGGGSLLDIGIYPIFISLLLLGTPVETASIAQLSKTGIDQHCAMLMKFKNGATAILESTFLTMTSNEAALYGSKGKITMQAPFHHTEKIVVEINGTEPYQIASPMIGNGYAHEIEEVKNCLIAGKIESDKMSFINSLELMKTLDLIRSQVNLTY